MKQWEELVRKLIRENLSLGILVAQAEPEFYEGLIILRYPQQHRRYLEANEHRAEINAWFSKHGLEIDIDTIAL
jgi:hypothetical protein